MVFANFINGCCINTEIYGYYCMVKMNEITKVTLNVDSKIYEEFKEYCKKRGLVVSKTIELYMANKLKEETKDE